MLCHVKTVMHGDLFSSRLYPCIKTWHLQLSIDSERLFQDCLGCINQALIVRAFLGCQQEVRLSVFEYLYGEGDQCVSFFTCICVGVTYVSVCMCVCAFVCLRVCVCECVYAFVCMCVHMHMCVHM